MNPFFFGSSKSPLFGAYHAPTNQPARPRGVVICNPFGDEALKAHRALLQLARTLADARFHVLRFDYHGTGDSFGEDQQARVARWVEDIGTATDELKDTAGVNKVSLVGLRLGGTLAALAGRERRDLDRIALWDPVIDGRGYVAFLRRAHEAFVKEEFGPDGPDDGIVLREDEIMGFPFPRELRTELEAIDLASLEPNRLRQVAVIASTRGAELERLHQHFEAEKVETAIMHVPVGVNWNSDEAMESSLVPKEALDAIVEALS
ncbi:MAG: alpha/beta hydrolase [Polyangiaceae bacterium]